MNENRFRALQHSLAMRFEAGADDPDAAYALAHHAGRMSLLADLIETDVFEDAGLDDWYASAAYALTGEDTEPCPSCGRQCIPGDLIPCDICGLGQCLACTENPGPCPKA